MLLKTKIFRQMVLFAVIPSLLVAASAYLFLRLALEQSGTLMAAAAPERTINSLRLLETRLQEVAASRLESGPPDSVRRNLEWFCLIRSDTVIGYGPETVPGLVDSLRKIDSWAAGPVRKIIGRYLLIGQADVRDSETIAGGFIIESEYLDGFVAVSQTLAESRGFRNVMPGFVLFILFGGLTILVLVIFMAYLLSRRLSATVTVPLERLTAITSVMARGEHPESIHLRGTEEIERLADSFNRMSDELDQNRRRLLAAERVAAWQEFARRMAHELKNPLTPISLSLYRIKKRLEESGQYAQFAEAMEAISAEVDHLNRLASDYGSLAQLPVPKIARFDFPRLTDEVLALFQAQLEGFHLERHGRIGPVEIEGDRDRLREVMVNLMKNALAFCDPGGIIAVSSVADGQNLRFTVSNSAAAVKEEQLKSARLPYFTTRRGGTGLGLAISEKIILDHGGTLTLEHHAGITSASFEIPLNRGES